ncbi:MAG: cysteine desulfurase family protein [Actinomycetes bacterium]
MVRHYLDHASTSPLRPQARAAMVESLDQFASHTAADPSRMHTEGMTTRVALENARAQVAELLGATSREVIFTSGATESITMAVWGALERGRHQPRRNHVVLSAVEHSAVRGSSEKFAGLVGGEVSIVGVDNHGRIDPAEVIDAVRPETILVHMQWGNHEVGTLQPLAEVSQRCKELDVLMHVDAAQAAGRVAIDFANMDADLVSVSGHKFGGPLGTGTLLVRRGLRIDPIMVGGEQERSRRAGMENIPAFVGLGAACLALATNEQLDHEQLLTQRLTQRVIDAVSTFDGVSVLGDPLHRLPQIVCLGIDGVEPQAVLLGLDQAGIAVHSGSACASEGLQDSPVLAAMGADAHHSLRISLGWSSTDADIDALLTALPDVLAHLRALGSRP